MSTQRQVISVRGCRTILRPPEKSDLPLFQWAMNDPEITHFLKTRPPISMVAEEQWFDRLAEREDYIFTVCQLDGTPIGCMGLHRPNWIDRTAISGSWLLKEFWGQGFGTDAKMHLLWYGFDRLNLHKICSAAYAFNGRSVGHNLHCGYQIEGRQKRQIFKDGRYHDLVVLGCFRKDWWPRFQAHLVKHNQS